MADLSRHFFTFRLLVPLPLVVDGGLTRWRIYLHYHGKGHAQASLIADCISTHREAVVIESGRAAVIERQASQELRAEEGTILHRIFSKLVRENRAVVVSTASRLRI